MKQRETRFGVSGFGLVGRGLTRKGHKTLFSLTPGFRDAARFGAGRAGGRLPDGKRRTVWRLADYCLIVVEDGCIVCCGRVKGEEYLAGLDFVRIKEYYGR